MDSATSMAHPQSPSSTDLAADFGELRLPLDSFRAPYPPRVQGSLPFTSPKATSTPTIKLEDPPLSDLPISPEAMNFGDSVAVQWNAHPEFSLDNAGQHHGNNHVDSPFMIASGGLYNYQQNLMSYNDNYNVTYAPQYSSSTYQRSYPGQNLTGLPHDASTSEAYPPSMYQIEPSIHYDSLSECGVEDHPMQMRDDYECHYGTQLHGEEHTGYNSPYSDVTRESTPNDVFSNPGPGGEDTTIDKDQPYAQLIYQALRQADGHTMVLRDIYDWFKTNTDKSAGSETKGWQNSIRHNLSMNGAFEKVEQPYDDSRKGFMWRLTEQALREGVRSTTRYRSKQPNKRGTRGRHPLPQRQASGAKGGHAASRSAHMKRSKRVQEHFEREPFIARSVPDTFAINYDSNEDDDKVAFPPSPFYGSGIENASSKHGAHHYDQFGSPHMANNGLELFPSTQTFPTPMSMGDTAYTLSQSPSEPLFTNSPTPPLDEPTTPMGQGTWSNDMRVGSPCSFNDMGMGYQQYVG